MKKCSLLFIVLLLMLASFTAGMEYQRGDVDQNGQVNIADVTCLIDYLMTGVWPDDPVPEEHEYVDLGLPSGTLWATMNIGANAPEEYGDYFAWGEIEPKEVYDWTTYKWCEGAESTLTKYCSKSEYGTVDTLTELEPEDDAAYVNWGPEWCMPTQAQQEELVDKCTWTWTTMNDVLGFEVTGPNGNTIFLPSGSSWSGDSQPSYSGYGNYWSRTLLWGGPNNARAMYFGSLPWYYWSSRYLGYSVRAVRVSQTTTSVRL